MRYLVLAVLALTLFPGSVFAADNLGSFGGSFANEGHPGLGGEPVLDAEALANLEPAAGDEMIDGEYVDGWVKDLHRAAEEMMRESGGIHSGNIDTPANR